MIKPIPHKPIQTFAGRHSEKNKIIWSTYTFFNTTNHFRNTFDSAKATLSSYTYLLMFFVCVFLCNVLFLLNSAYKKKPMLSFSVRPSQVRKTILIVFDFEVFKFMCVDVFYGRWLCQFSSKLSVANRVSQFWKWRLWCWPLGSGYALFALLFSFADCLCFSYLRRRLLCSLFLGLRWYVEILKGDFCGVLIAFLLATLGAFSRLRVFTEDFLW